ncbi:MAG: glycosyltransferase family 4 protein [Desulfobulbaceae bacterium]|nr:glycosyltransferase family 4 protein [Desulfobulbaceae bacterium]
MKILYFHQHFSTPQGSTGTRSYEMAKRLIARGHQVTMVCGSGFMAETGLKGEWRNGIRRGVVDGIDVIEINLVYSNYDSLPKRALVFLKYALKSTHIAWKEKYDVLFATSTPLTAGIPGIFMRILKPGKRFVFEVRDLWPELPKAMGVVSNPVVLLGMGILEQFSYAAMHAGVALSPGIRKGMLKGAGARKKVAMIPNGCDPEIFKPGKNEQEGDANLVPGVPQKGLRCIFIGAHGIANGLDAVLDAAGVLKEKGRTDISLLFVGDGKLKPHLKQRAVDEGLENCIFLDPIPKTRVPELLQQVDVGMMILDNVPAFYYGTSPNKFFDYIAAGLPVLNNYPGWLADMIAENKCGVVVPPEKPVAFADALEYMADNRDESAEMGKNARRVAERNFDRIELADRFVDWVEWNAKE